MFDGMPSHPLEHSHLKGIVESASWKIRKVSDGLIEMYESKEGEDPARFEEREEAEAFADLLRRMVLLLLKNDATIEELYARVYFMETGKFPEDAGYYESLEGSLGLPEEAVARVTQIRFWRNYFSHAPSHRAAYRRILGEKGKFVYALKPVCRDALKEAWKRYRAALESYGGPERYERELSEAWARRREERKRRNGEAAEKALRIRNDYRASCEDRRRVFDDLNARTRSDPSVQAAPLPLHEETLRMLVAAMCVARRTGRGPTINSVAHCVSSLKPLWEFVASAGAWEDPDLEPVLRVHGLEPGRPPSRPKRRHYARTHGAHAKRILAALDRAGSR